MGVVNVTPDSFSDGGRYLSTTAALAHGERLIEEGADLLDIGGESTRPGAADVSEMEEIERVLPLVRSTQNTESAAGSWDPEGEFLGRYVGRLYSTVVHILILEACAPSSGR